MLLINTILFISLFLLAFYHTSPLSSFPLPLSTFPLSHIHTLSLSPSLRPSLSHSLILSPPTPPPPPSKVLNLLSLSKDHPERQNAVCNIYVCVRKPADNSAALL